MHPRSEGNFSGRLDKCATWCIFGIVTVSNLEAVHDDALTTLVRQHSRKSVRLCGRFARVVPHALFTEHRMTVTGLTRCGSPWSCPQCALRLRTKRSVAIQAIAADVVGSGGSLFLATLTLRHNVGMFLADLLGAISAGWCAVRNSRLYKGDLERLGILGFVKSLEVTYGVNGWHPHLHVLFFSSRELCPSELASFESVLSSIWIASVFKSLGVSPSNDVGVDVRRMSADNSGYIAKVGYEMAGTGKGSSPFGLLLAGDLIHWHEFDEAMQGVRSITISRQLGDEYSDVWGGSDMDLIDDEDLDGEPIVLDVVIDPSVWYFLSGSVELQREFDTACRGGVLNLQSWYWLQIARGNLPEVPIAFWYRKIGCEYIEVTS